MMNSIVLGVDIGGSHITTAIVDLKTRKIIKESWYRESVDSQSSSGEIILSWCKAIRKSMSGHHTKQVFLGIAMPGPFDYENGICYIKGQNKFEALYNVCVKKLLSDELGIPSNQIRFINDAASFLQGEVFSGTARDYDISFGITLGTGLGSAISKYGETEDADLWSVPFKKGIAEDYLSSRWFLNRYAQNTSRVSKNVKDLAEQYHDDQEVQKLFTEFGENLADFISVIMQRENPGMVVLGGSISESFDLFYTPLMNRLLNNKDGNVEVKASALKENASILGAASCWQEVEEVKN